MDVFPDYPLSQGSAPTTRVRVPEKQLGDGYTQAAADGLNNVQMSFRAVFNVRPKADIEVIAAFLRRHGGHTPFRFQLPDEDMPRQWRCKSWSGPTWVAATHRSLTATFEEDFDL